MCEELRKHTIRDTIQTLFNQRIHYKKQGSPLQVAFKLIVNSAYGRIVMKNIKNNNKHIPNELIPEYVDKKYNLLEGIYTVNAERSVTKLRK